MGRGPVRQIQKNRTPSSCARTAREADAGIIVIEIARMKVAWVETVGSLDNLKLVERPEPRPGRGEVLVRLRAASLNYRDLVTTAGGYGSHQRRENLIPLSDGAGEIAALGDGVTAWKMGDRVTGHIFPKWLTGPPTEARSADLRMASPASIAFSAKTRSCACRITSLLRKAPPSPAPR